MILENGQINMELLMKNRKNLLIGSTSQHGEIYYELKWWWDGVKDYKKMAEFYMLNQVFYMNIFLGLSIILHMNHLFFQEKLMEMGI